MKEDREEKNRKRRFQIWVSRIQTRRVLDGMQWIFSTKTAKKSRKRIGRRKIYKGDKG